MAGDRSDDLRSRLELLLSTRDGLGNEIEELAGLGQDAVPILIDMINQGGRDTKFYERAILALGVFAGQEVLDSLLENLHQGDMMKVISALTSLRKIGSSEQTSVVVALLDDPREPVRKEAIKTLAVLGDKTALNPLKEIAESQDKEYLRELAREAIEEIEKRID